MMAKARRKQSRRKQRVDKVGKPLHELVGLLKRHENPSTTAEQKKQLIMQAKAKFDFILEEIAQTTAEQDEAEGKLPD